MQKFPHYASNSQKCNEISILFNWKCIYSNRQEVFEHHEIYMYRLCHLSTNIQSGDKNGNGNMQVSKVCCVTLVKMFGMLRKLGSRVNHSFRFQICSQISHKINIFIDNRFPILITPYIINKFTPHGLSINQTFSSGLC